MLCVSIRRRRKFFSRIVSVLILMISVRKGGWPSKLPDARLSGRSLSVQRKKNWPSGMCTYLTAFNNLARSVYV
jgi:hypothetical protein